MKTLIKHLLPLVLLAALQGVAADGPYVYVGAFAPDDGSGQFGRLDLADGSFHLIVNHDVAMIGIAKSAGNIYGMDSDGKFYKIDADSGELTQAGKAGVTSHNPNGVITLFAGLAGGALYALDFDFNLYSINPDNGVATLVANTGLTPITSDRFGDSLTADANNLYFTYDMGLPSPGPALPLLVEPALYRIDPKTGKATRVSAAPSFISGSVYADGKLYLFRLNVSDEGDDVVIVPDNLATIDTQTGQVAELAKPAPCLGFAWGGIPAPAPLMTHSQEPFATPRPAKLRSYGTARSCFSCAPRQAKK